MLQAILAMPIFTVALLMPTVRMKSFTLSFCLAKTCSRRTYSFAAENALAPLRRKRVGCLVLRHDQNSPFLLAPRASRPRPPRSRQR